MVQDKRKIASVSISDQASKRFSKGSFRRNICQLFISLLFNFLMILASLGLPSPSQ
uniref:Uncharacterized protein n=1 Tax=Rhizophora mucronata TaxID=61149 RepID=A0A2P2R006_RHIMU